MDTILTLEEVATYLKVSERTVKDWVNAGEFPGGKIGNSWRFRRGDIVNWVDKQLTPHKHYNTGNSIQSIETMLDPKRILFTKSTSKADVLNRLIDAGENVPGVSSRSELADAVFAREKLMSTGIGLSIAVPHVRLNGVENVYVVFAVNEPPLSDYEALDGIPVKILMFFIAGRNQHTEYIQALSIFSNLLKQPLIRERILESKDPNEVYKTLTE